MKVATKTWFTPLVATNGMIACAIRKPDGKCLHPDAEMKYPPEKIAKLLGQYAGLHQPLAIKDADTRWVTWAFEYGHLRYVPRPDKWLLLLLATPETDAIQALDRFSEEFLATEFK
jgi:hypothetical protein